MLENIKDKTRRQGFIALLTHIVTGTQSTAGFAFVPQEEGQKLAKAEPTFVTLDPSVKNAEGQIKAVATQLAIDAVTNQSSAPAAPAAEKAPKADPINYEIVSLDSIPEIKRGGNKGDSYPFEQLKPFPEPGHAFYVPATEARPNPAKALASTVASANKRAKGEKTYTVRKHVVDGKITGAHVIRTK